MLPFYPKLMAQIKEELFTETSLYLDNEKIDDNQLQLLIDALLELNSMNKIKFNYLNLRGNKISDASGPCLAKFIEQFPACTIILSHNQITDVGVIDLIPALEQMITLRDTGYACSSGRTDLLASSLYCPEVCT